MTDKTNSTLRLSVSVPIASFAVPYAREFVEIFPFPPPTTVYGMLLSLIGETDRFRYEGCKISIQVLGTPEMSVVLRKIRRFKDKEINSKNNSKPDYQMLLTGLEFIVGVEDSEHENVPSLCQLLREALANPATINRFGGLSCGESHNLVDEIQLWQNGDSSKQVWNLRPDENGEWSVPLWVDHVGSAGTRWQTVTFEPTDIKDFNEYFFIIASRDFKDNNLQ